MAAVKVKAVILEFITIFAVSFIVTAVVNYLFALVTNRQEGVDFQSAFRFAILFGVLITWVHNKSPKR